MSEFQKQSNKRDGKEREMEKKVASYSWWWDSHKNSQQSQWLQSTLSDLDQKTKIMLTLIQEDGDSFAKRAEMYYKKRPELVKMVEEFHRSYRSLAERYDQLKSDPTHISGSSSSSSSNSIKHLQTDQNGSKTEETCSEKSKIPSQNSEPDSTVEDPDLEISKENANESIKCELGQSKMEKGEQLIIIQEEKINKDEYNGESFVHFGNHNLLEREAMWSEMKLEVSRLMKENLKNQTELIKRNDEKREDIRELRHHIEKLLEENRTLQNKLRSSTKISNRQKLKSLFLGKFQ